MSDRAPDFFKAQPTPAKGEEKCDFCSAPNPLWAFPCRNYAQTEIGLMMSETGHQQAIEIEAISEGEWAACQVCYLLIQKGDRVRLARRSAKRLIRSLDPDFAKAWPLSNAIEHIRRIHDNFWQNRKGNPERIK